MNWLLLRGLSREKRHWSRFPARFQERVGGRIHCLDLPGMGTEHHRRSPASIDAIVADVRARWQPLREEHGGPWGLFAVSLGGMAAMAWCGTYPEDFERLVLVSTSARDLSSPFRRFSLTLVPSLVRALATRDPVRREEHVLAMTTRLLRDRRAVATEWSRYQHDRPVARENVLRQLLAASVFRVPARIDVPALVLAGARDAMVHASCARRLADRLAAAVAIHPEAGHDLAIDAPEWLADQVASWIDASETATTRTTPRA